MGELVRKLGTEKSINMTKDLDLILDKYRKIANASGYYGALKFQKEGGFTVVFVEINDEVKEEE